MGSATIADVLFICELNRLSLEIYLFSTMNCTLSSGLFVFILFAAVFTAKAEIGRGCYVGGVLYTENTAKGNRFFYRAPGNLVSDCGYNPIGNDGNCRLYNGGNINNNNSYTLYEDAFSNKWEEIECPIDTYVWFLLIAVAGVSYFYKPIYARQGQ